MKRALTILTNSEMQTARDCMIKHQFAYKLALRPKATPRALSFGTAFHEGVACLYRTIGTVPHDEVEELGLERGLVAIEQSMEAWFQKTEPLTSADQMAELAGYAADAVLDARWMFKHYVHTFRDDIRRLVPLAVERPFSVPMRNVLGRVVPHLQYTGVWDLVAYDPEHGDIVLMDHKTTKGPIDTIDRKVEIDTQMAGYLYALRQTMEASVFPAICSEHPYFVQHRRVLGEAYAQTRIGRIAYNVVRKKRPTAPHINKDGTVSVAEIDTLPEIYEHALEQQQEPEWFTRARETLDGMPPGARGYDKARDKFMEQRERWTELQSKQASVLQRLRDRGDTFIGRREFFRTPDEIERWRREAFVQANRIRMAETDDSLRYRNPGHCTGPGSMPCSYRSLCIDDAPELRAAFDVGPRHPEVVNANRDAEED